MGQKISFSHWKNNGTRFSRVCANARTGERKKEEPGIRSGKGVSCIFSTLYNTHRNPALLIIPYMGW